MNNSEKTIDYCKNLKAHTEAEIFRLLNNYRTQTGLEVRSISLDYHTLSGSVKALVKVKIEIIL